MMIESVPYNDECNINRKGMYRQKQQQQQQQFKDTSRVTSRQSSMIAMREFRVSFASAWKSIIYDKIH